MVHSSPMGFRQPAGAVGGLGVRALGLIVAVLGWGISLFSGTVSVSAADNAVNHEQQYREQLVPLLVTYCKDCHVGMDAEGGFNLQRSPSAASLLKNRKDWLRALTQVQGKVMPPQDGPAMDDATRGRMTKLIDELANAADCIANPNAGKVVMRRLTRTEYRNTIRDLVGIDYEPAASFPADDIGYGLITSAMC